MGSSLSSVWVFLLSVLQVDALHIYISLGWGHIQWQKKERSFLFIPVPWRVASEYWMIFRGPGFLAIVWFDSSPAPSPSLFLQQVRTGVATHRKTEEERQVAKLLTGGGTGGWGAKSYDGEKAWSSINHSYSLVVTCNSSIHVHTEWYTNLKMRVTGSYPRVPHYSLTCRPEKTFINLYGTVLFFILRISIPSPSPSSPSSLENNKL
jgi:hypothetical protein